MSSERAEIQVDASQGGGGAGSGATGDDDNAARRRLGFAQPVRDIRQQALTRPAPGQGLPVTSTITQDRPAVTTESPDPALLSTVDDPDGLRDRRLRGIFGEFAA